MKSASAKFLGLGPNYCQDNSVSKVTNQELATGIRVLAAEEMLPITATSKSARGLSSLSNGYRS
jgi:hypothetical protein